MNIGVIGSGPIGTSLASAFAAAGHTVKMANSRGPESIEEHAASIGARATTVEQAVEGVEIVVTSVPLGRVPDLRPFIAPLGDDVVVIDTSNYYPARDGHIAALDDGTPEAVWVSEQLGHPVVRAWNAVLAGTLADEQRPKGSSGRIALPVAGDDARGRAVGLELTELTGFDAVDIGGLADSWRVQPGGPAYCTALSVEQLHAALTQAERDVIPKRRDLVMSAISLFRDELRTDDLLNINRAVNQLRVP